jgi:hypothetical protein
VSCFSNFFYLSSVYLFISLFIHFSPSGRRPQTSPSHIGLIGHLENSADATGRPIDIDRLSTLLFLSRVSGSWKKKKKRGGQN